ncbi:MAG: cytidylate kinase-like family protein [Clostridia bacterium]|nr:cytidylate kinase-like family protein [Clostridia bacterium]
MDRFIVTIGREFGSAGKEIGRELAWYLGVEYYDKTKIAELSKEYGVFDEEINNVDESVNARSKGLFKGAFNRKNAEKYDSMIDAQTKVIRDLADRESCVIIGRCADYVLRDRDNVLNVFIYAPYDLRTKRIMDLYGFSKAQTEKIVKKIDNQRHEYYKYVTGKQRGDMHGKDILIDSSLFGLKGTAEILFEITKKRFDLDIPAKII